jgi:hypothetical protein
MDKLFNLVNHFWAHLDGDREGYRHPSGPHQIFWLVWINLFWWGAVMRDLQLGIFRMIGFICLSAALVLAIRMLWKVRNSTMSGSEPV